MAPAGSTPAGVADIREVAVLLPALVALSAVVFFVLAGLNVAGKRFNPAYFGWACAAVVVWWSLLGALKG